MIPDDLLSSLFLITVIATFAVVLFLAWAMSSSINCSRRMADSLEKLVRKLDQTAEKEYSEKEWTIEEPPGGPAEEFDLHWAQPKPGTEQGKNTQMDI